MTEDEIREALAKLWVEVAPIDKNIHINTGKGGAILFQEGLLGRPLTQEEKDAYEDGTYSIDSLEGLKYHGLFDSSVKDGVLLVKIKGKWLLEEWLGGWRTRKSELTEEEAQKLIKENE